MGQKRYVQHISGQGEKWKLEDSPYNDRGHDDYIVNGKNTYHYLPRSEYRLCDPPERWEDVTQEVGNNQEHRGLKVSGILTAFLPPGHRWKFRSDGGLHIEKLVQP